MAVRNRAASSRPRYSSGSGGARLYLPDDDNKIKTEHVIFYVAPDSPEQADQTDQITTAPGGRCGITGP